MTEIIKIWKIHVDIEGESSAPNFILIQNDVDSYNMEFKFVKNRREIPLNFNLSDKIFLHFTLPKLEQTIQLTNIQHDIGIYQIPNYFLLNSGSASLQIQIRENGELIKELNKINFKIQPSPWEVN